MQDKQKHPKTIFDLATDNYKISAKGLTLEEALAQVDETGGDEELKQIIREGYNFKRKDLKE